MEEKHQFKQDELQRLKEFISMTDEEFCNWVLEGVPEEAQKEFLEEFAELQKE